MIRIRKFAIIWVEWAISEVKLIYQKSDFKFMALFINLHNMAIRLYGYENHRKVIHYIRIFSSIHNCNCNNQLLQTFYDVNDFIIWPGNHEKLYMNQFPEVEHNPVSLSFFFFLGEEGRMHNSYYR